MNYYLLLFLLWSSSVINRFFCFLRFLVLCSFIFRLQQWTCRMTLVITLWWWLWLLEHVDQSTVENVLVGFPGVVSGWMGYFISLLLLLLLVLVFDCFQQRTCDCSRAILPDIRLCSAKFGKLVYLLIIWNYLPFVYASAGFFRLCRHCRPPFLYFYLLLLRLFYCFWMPN
jgi:hypothetical protein